MVGGVKVVAKMKFNRAHVKLLEESSSSTAHVHICLVSQSLSFIEKDHYYGKTSKEKGASYVSEVRGFTFCSA